MVEICFRWRHWAYGDWTPVRDCGWDGVKSFQQSSRNKWLPRVLVGVNLAGCVSPVHWDCVITSARAASETVIHLIFSECGFIFGKIALMRAQRFKNCCQCFLPWSTQESVLAWDQILRFFFFFFWRLSFTDRTRTSPKIKLVTQGALFKTKMRHAKPRSRCSIRLWHLTFHH